MPKISAIVPVYIKHEDQIPWLEECLNSICPVVDEVIVMDDGSPVDLSDVQVVGDNIEWYRLGTNHGTSRARNLAVEYASNDLIFPLDCDDLIIPEAFELFIAEWDGTPLYPDLMKLRSNGDSKIHRLLDFQCDLLMKHIGISSVNVLHTKAQWNSVGRWDEDIEYLEDGEYNTRLMYWFCAKRVPIPVVKYRQHKYQKTRLHSSEHEQQLRQMLVKVRNYMDTQDVGSI